MMDLLVAYGPFAAPLVLALLVGPKRARRVLRAIYAAWRGAPILIAESTIEGEDDRGAKNVRVTRKDGDLEVLLYWGRDKARGRRAAEHSYRIGRRGILFMVDGDDRTPPEWR